MSYVNLWSRGTNYANVHKAPETHVWDNTSKEKLTNKYRIFILSFEQREFVWLTVHNRDFDRYRIIQRHKLKEKVVSELTATLVYYFTHILNI